MILRFMAGQKASAVGGFCYEVLSNRDILLRDINLVTLDHGYCTTRLYRVVISL